MLELRYDNKVSFVQGPPDALVLIGVELVAMGDAVLTWFDPSHQRAFTVEKIIRDEPGPRGVLEFDTAEGRFKMQRLTLPLYNRIVRPQTHGPVFASRQSMEQFFLDNWGMG